MAVKPKGKMTFTVDSALLKELGERLVGRAHIALAELVKNAYDADALSCDIIFQEDSIEIVDNGHGMDFHDFERFWMRVGTTHKQREEFSPEFERPLTGSKGVGRLAVQFLAHSVHIETTPKGKRQTLEVDVDWDSAVHHEYLTEATADYELKKSPCRYANGSRHGFRIILSGLRQDWNSQSLKELAQEVWTLRPPFDGFAGKEGYDEAKDFKINLSAPDIEGAEAFDAQAEAAVENWIAKIQGSIESGWREHRQVVTLTFRDGSSYRETFEIDGCRLENAAWEIRVFNLSGHQGGKIKVGDARKYFSEYGGVHVYDGPFRLPYYGIHQDWLNLEYDHSHRRVRSKLLPSHYHVDRALNDLPTQGRILGVVRVDTGQEMHKAPPRKRKKGEHLKIQVTRDRLQINRSYEQLRDAVRRSLDYYAVCSMRRRLQAAKMARPKESADKGLKRFQQVLSAHQAAIPHEIFDDLTKETRAFVKTTRQEQEYRDTLAALLGPLASAGMAALALDHETGRELTVLEGIARRVAKLERGAEDAPAIADEIREWVARGRKLRRVFEPLSNAEDREKIVALRAERVLKLVKTNLSTFLAGVEIELDVNRTLRLPAATLAEWQGLFQNVVTNALNAMVDIDARRSLYISGGRGPGKKAWVRISDNGSGIDLEQADRFFEPFQRQGEISEDRKSMGLGGHGLGLTIVRMIAEGHRCKAQFVEPEQGFSTTFELSWTQQSDD